MKKMYILPLILFCSGLMAKSLKQRVKELEKKVAELAYNEELAWKELKKMNKDVTRLEENELINSEEQEHLLLPQEIVVEEIDLD